jgi:orotate phosphoribosyltransferase
MYFRTVQDMEQQLRGMLPKIPRDIDVVAGIPRSGMAPAALLALYLNRPMTDVEGLFEGRLIRSGERPVKAGGSFAEVKKVLVVDDCVSSGNQLKKIKQKLADAALPFELLYAAPFVTEAGEPLVDFHGEVIGWPQCYQWNLMQHPDYLGRACVDMDGVLCQNPLPAQDDGAEAYEDFLENAPPLFTPTHRIGWIVTSRLERYRPQTEAWLQRYGITYDHLIMMEGGQPTPAERAERGVKLKADAYVKNQALIFIESDLPVAAAIAKRSGRPVVSVDVQQLVTPGFTPSVLTARLRSSPRAVFRRVKRKVRGAARRKPLNGRAH